MEKKKNSRKAVIKHLDYLVFGVVGVLFAVFTFAGFFTKLDFRFYDFLLASARQPAQSKNIVISEIDDKSIAELGEWPWSRDIIGDCLIHMKELGSERVIFDVEYLSPSPKGVNSKLQNKIDSSFGEVEDSMKQLSESIGNGKLRLYGGADLFDNYLNPQIDYLKYTVMENAYKDNDEYFGRALQFLGNSWLTVNNQNVAIEAGEENLSYIDSRLMLENVTDTNDRTFLDNKYTSREQYNGLKPGFSPALGTLVRRSVGLGFTNTIVDSDGTRRRIELLYKYNDKFVGQLAFAPLLDYLDVERIERKKKSLVLYNAKYPGSESREDVSIPLDEHGRMLISWMHGSYTDSFIHESMYHLKLLDFIEDDISQILNNLWYELRLSSRGGTPLQYVAIAGGLLDRYNAINERKDELLALCTGYDEKNRILDGISDEMYQDYFQMRKNYFEDVKEYSSSGFGGEISARLMELKESGVIDEDGMSDFISVVKEQFSYLAQSIDDYLFNVENLKKHYDGAFVIIGQTASSTSDIGGTPFNRLYQNVGTHANVANTIMQKDFITPVPWYLGYLVAFIAAGITVFIVHNMSNKFQNIINGSVSFCLIIAPMIMMSRFKTYLPFVGTVLFVMINYFGGIVIRFINSSKEKEFIRQTFSQFVAKEVVDEIIKDPEKANLGGRNEHITALFSDIKSFSSFSELVTPEQLVNILNEYLGALSDKILINSGTIDKYIGDSIVSLFGAPIRLENHAFAACSAAVRMKQAESDFNRKHMIEGDIPIELYTRIGINTGDMVVGNMGTALKKNYTMMGDNVNLASRLEGVNKVYGTWILCSEQTWKEADYGVHKGELVARKLDQVRVVGKTIPVQLYNILGFRAEMNSNQLEEIDLFHEALELYLNRNFAAAGKNFLQANEMIPDDQAALIFAERCKVNIEKGVPENWDGIMNLTSK